MDIYIQEANGRPERIADFPLQQLEMDNLRLQCPEGYRNYKVVSRFGFGDVHVLKVEKMTSSSDNVITLFK